MEEMSVVIMEKDNETGFLSRELGTYAVNYDIDLIQTVFAKKESDEILVYLYITFPGEFKDWEYNAILDNYNMELFQDIVTSIEEDEENYNPGWIVKFVFQDSDAVKEKKINEILRIHVSEMERVLKEIPSFEEDYQQ